jgi:hypothetical protein
MGDTQRYRSEAEQATRRSLLAKSPMEREAYLQIAEGWRKLAAHAADLEARMKSAAAPLVTR